MADLPFTSAVSLTAVEAGWNATRNCMNYAYPERGEIRTALVKRLVAYALKELTDAGFGPVLANCTAEVLTTDAEMSPSDRSYQVTFKTPAGGTLSVNEILMGRGGWPVLDHGFSASRP